MPDQWMTLASAAANLNVHPRTIERRIASGKIQSRRTDDGQLQVLINLPEASNPMPSPLETVKELAQDQVNLATGASSAIVRLAQSDSQRARGELSLVRQEAERVRQASKIAWTSVGAMAVFICSAVGWTTYQLTSSHAEIKELQQTASRVEDEAQKLVNERDDARKQLQRAELAAADANGRLAAYTEQSRSLIDAEVKQRIALATPVSSDNRPTTQPTNLLQRIATLSGGD